MSDGSPYEDLTRLEQLFDQALALPPSERDAFARETCGKDEQMLARLRSLLTAHDQEQEASEILQRSLSQMQEPLRRRLGPYEIDSLLGRGGMGAVYLARRADGQYEKTVAIKIVDLPLATEAFYDRFRQERQILAGLDHPHIARLLDGGVSDDGILFLVMEYVEGVRIDEYCRSHNLTLEEKLRLFIAVCGAVQFAHRNLVIHRDIKPDNVLVSEDGTPHLLDFGTAKLIARDGSVETRGLTREGFLSFTPEYASPEQVLGRPIGTTSDVYSLGVLLYQMLTGRLPYELSDFSAEEMIRIVCERPIARPTSADNTFPDADLEAILTKALRKEPEQRYQSVEQLTADLQAYLDHKPVLARKGNLQYLAAKFVRRNRLAISLTAGIVLAVIAGTVAVLHQTRATRAAEQTTEANANDMSHLSDTLLTQLDDTIKQLPGSTQAQQVLVSRVLENLNRAAQNPHSNLPTQISLVNAFVRLGNLQANPYEQNLGDTAGALQSLGKAMEIATHLEEQHPHDPAVLLALARAQDSRGEILSFANNNAGAAENLQASVKTYEELLSTQAATPALFFEAGSVIDVLGDLMGQDTGFADAEAALLEYRRAISMDDRALAIDPNFMPSRRGLVSMHLKIANVLLDAEPAAALEELRGAMARLDALPKSEQSRLDLKRLQALLLRKQGVALADLGRYSEANPLFAQATSAYQAIAGTDERDVRALRDLDRLLTNETFSYESAANPLLASPGASSRKSLAIAEKLEAERADVLTRLLKLQPNDTSTKQELAAVTVRMDALKDPPATSDEVALQKDREALNVLRDAASDSKSSPMQLDLAFHALMEAEPISLRDPAAALTCAQRGVELTHRKSAEWLLSLAQAYRSNGNIPQAQATAKEGLELLPAKPEEQGFYLRKLLRSEMR